MRISMGAFIPAAPFRQSRPGHRADRQRVQALLTDKHYPWGVYASTGQACNELLNAALISRVGLIRLKCWRRSSYIGVLDTDNLTFISIVKPTQLVITPTYVHVGRRIQENKNIRTPDLVFDPLPPVSSTRHFLANIDRKHSF